MNDQPTTMTRIVLPSMLNDRQILFGGNILKWMDEVAYITATRLLMQRVVTFSVEDIKFLKPFGLGDIIEINGRITKIGNVKIEISVVATRELAGLGLREKAAEAKFFFTAVDEHNIPKRIDLKNSEQEYDSLHHN
jgi:acyl-CoA hydrolase